MICDRLHWWPNKQINHFLPVWLLYRTVSQPLLTKFGEHHVFSRKQLRASPDVFPIVPTGTLLGGAMLN